MKNKTVNKKVLRAMSIGLAAMMTVQPILATPVFADDTEPVDDSNTTTYDDEQHKSETTNDAREAVDNAEESVSTVVDDVQDNVVEGEAGTTNGVDNATAVIEATNIPVYGENGELLNESKLIPEVLEEIAGSLKAVDAAVTTAETAKEHWADNDYQNFGTGYAEKKNMNDAADAAQTAVDNEDQANSAINAAASLGDSAVDAAVEKYNEGKNAVAEAEEVVNDTTKKYEDLVNVIANASSISDATKAYDDLGQLLDDTQATIKDKQEILNTANDAFASIVDDIKKYEGDVTKAKEEFADAEADYLAAQKKYEYWDGNLKDKVETIEKYNAAYELAKSNLAAAEENLEIVSEKAEALSQAVETAKLAVMTDNAAALDVVANIGIVHNDTASWRKKDDLFESIMKNYYLPEALGEKFDADTISFTWVNDNKANIPIELRSFDKNSCNYCIITYDKVNADGTIETVTKYYNYSMEKDANGKESKENLIIFEKRENEVNANSALVNNANSLLYNDGVDVDYYEVGGKKYESKEALEAAEGIEKIGSVYYQVNGITNTTLSVETDDGNIIKVNETDIVNDENTKTVVTIGDYAARESFEKDENGKVVHVYEADATTVVYHPDNSLSKNEAVNTEGDLKFTSAAAAQAALDEAKSGLDVISASVTEVNERQATMAVETKTYEASYTISGVATFPAKIEITETSSKFNLNVFNYESEIKNLKDQNTTKIINNAKTLYENQPAKINDKNVFVLKIDGIDSETRNDEVTYRGFIKQWGGIKVDTKAKVNVTCADISTIDVTTNKEVNALKKVLKKELNYIKNPGESDAKAFTNALSNLSVDDAKELGFLYLDVKDGKISYVLGGEEKTITATATGTQVIDKYGNVDIEATNAAYTEKQLEAKENLIAELKALGIVNPDVADAVVKTTGSASAEYTKQTWGYNLSYWKQYGETTTTTVTKTEEYANAATVKGKVTQNKNKTANPKLIESKDEDFKKFIGDAKGLSDKYERLLKEAESAKSKVEIANNEVSALRNIVNGLSKIEIIKNGVDKSQTIGTINETLAVKKLPTSGVMRQASVKSIIDSLIKAGVDFGDKNIEDLTIADIKAVLDAEQIKLDDLKKQVQELVDSMDDVATQLAATIVRLTPSESEPDYTPFVAEPAQSVAVIGGDAVAPRPAVLPLATTPTAGVAGARTRRTGNGTGAGYLEETAGGELITGDELKGELPVVDKDEKVTEITDEVIKTIQDEQVPLAAFPEEAAKKMNWWWLLLIAILGVTGEEMYRRNEKKKEEKAALRAEMNKKNK